MGNRFINPWPQFLNDSGVVRSGGGIAFYLTGTSTPASTFQNSTLSTPNSNPVPFDSAGRPTQEIFLDPNVTYKAVFLSDYTNLSSVVRTLDPVVDPAANVTAAIQVYPGNPNGNLAGNQGTPGGSGASMAWDSTNNLLYICITTGTAATAVWTSSAASLAGAVVMSGIITPASLSGSPAADAYSPSGFSGCSEVRQDLSADVNILDLPAGLNGQQFRWRNISTANTATFVNQNSGSTAARRLSLPGPVNVGPNESIDLKYDGLQARWYMFCHTGANGRTILTDAATVAWDVSTGVDFQVTITASRTLGAFTNGTPGKEGRLFVRQDGTGGFGLDLSNAVYDFWAATVENIARGANDETEYAYKVVSSGSMLLRRVGATSIGHTPGRQLLSAQTASASATIDFVLTKWLEIYDRFEVDIDDLLPATDSTDLWMRTSTNGGSSYDAGASDYFTLWTRITSGASDAGGGAAAALTLFTSGTNLSNVAGETCSGTVRLYNPRATGKLKVTATMISLTPNPANIFCKLEIGGVRDTAADVDAIRFMISSGNIASGSFRLFGVRK